MHFIVISVFREEQSRKKVKQLQKQLLDIKKEKEIEVQVILFSKFFIRNVS